MIGDTLRRPALGAIVLLMLCPTVGRAEPKPLKDYHEEVRQDLHKNLSTHMWSEMQSMLDQSPSQTSNTHMDSNKDLFQEIELTPQEKQAWSKLLQLNGKTPFLQSNTDMDPMRKPPAAWLEQLRKAPPQNIEEHP